MNAPLKADASSRSGIAEKITTVAAIVALPVAWGRLGAYSAGIGIVIPALEILGLGIIAALVSSWVWATARSLKRGFSAQAGAPGGTIGASLFQLALGLGGMAFALFVIYGLSAKEKIDTTDGFIHTANRITEALVLPKLPPPASLAPRPITFNFCAEVKKAAYYYSYDRLMAGQLDAGQAVLVVGIYHERQGKYALMANKLVAQVLILPGSGTALIYADYLQQNRNPDACNDIKSAFYVRPSIPSGPPTTAPALP